MKIVKASIDDVDALLKIEKECFDDPWPRASFENDINNELTDFIVLKDNDEIIGFYDVWYMFENADIANIAISKDYQGKGLGEKLLKDLIVRCIKKEVEFLHLEVSVENTKAYNLYKKLGFEEVRTRIGYYNGVDAKDMVKGLIGLSEKDFSD